MDTRKMIKPPKGPSKVVSHKPGNRGTTTLTLENGYSFITETPELYPVDSKVVVTPFMGAVKISVVNEN